MKKSMKGFIAGILLTTLLLSTFTVFATTTRTIEVNFGGYRTFLHGQEITANNAQGQRVVPFSYDGSVYIPIELILQAMGDSVRWDADARILHFEQIVATNYTWLDQMGFTNHQTSGVLNISSAWPQGRRATDGSAFDRGLLFVHNTMGVLGFSGGSRHANGRWHNYHDKEFELGGNYSTFTGTIVCAEIDIVRDFVSHLASTPLNRREQLNNNQQAAQVRFYGDRELIYSSPFISAPTTPIAFSVDVSGVQTLRINVSIPNISGGRAESITAIGLVDSRFEQ